MKRGGEATRSSGGRPDRRRHRGCRVGLLTVLGVALASGALAASHEPEAEMPTSKKYERTDTATIERIQEGVLVVTDPAREGAALRYATDAETVVVRPDGHEAGLDVLAVGDRVAIDAHDRLEKGDPVAKVIHVVVESGAGGDAAE